MKEEKKEVEGGETVKTNEDGSQTAMKVKENGKEDLDETLKAEESKEREISGGGSDVGGKCKEELHEEKGEEGTTGAPPASPAHDSAADEDGEDGEDGAPLADETPDSLTAAGLELLRAKEFNAALHKLSWALELKLKSLDFDELHVDLAPFYLNYGNALQTKEENSNELFVFEQGSVVQPDAAVAESSTSASASSAQVPTPVDCRGGEPRGGVTDDELAWENLEMARVVIEKYIQKEEQRNVSEELSSETNCLSESKPRIALSLIEDLSFARVRLGDMNVLQEQYSDAMENYQVAVDLRRKYEMPYTSLTAPLISLGQAQQFALFPHEAIKTFENVQSLIRDQLEGVGGYTVPDDRKRDFEMTLEDVTIQIPEIKKGIADGTFEKARVERENAAAARSQQQGSSSASSSACPPAPSSAIGLSGRTGSSLFSADNSVESCFSKPQLSGEDGLVDLGVVSSKRKGGQSVAVDVSRKADPKADDQKAEETENGEDEGGSLKKKRRIDVE